MRTLKQRPASAERHAGVHGPLDAASVAVERNIAEPLASIIMRLRRVLDKLVDARSALVNGDAAVARMQRELHQLRREKAALATQLDELSRKHVKTRHEAFHDELTGLPNRKSLHDCFDIATHACELRQQQLVLLFIDLDNFKQINDDFGHSVGDQVLQVVARRLQAAIRTTDIACRYGGDEFVILATDIQSTTSAVEFAAHICDRLAARFQICGTHIDLRASVGIAIYPDDCHDWEELVHRADAQMYRSRAQRRKENPGRLCAAPAPNDAE